MSNSPTIELSANARSLIATVVTRTRLRRRERADIERELTAHFLDGLASGASEDALIDAFGDARAAAIHLRIAAISKRSPLDRAFRSLRIFTAWSAAACIGAYGCAVIYLSTQRPVISFDALARLRASLPRVTESERAWPLYKRGLIALADPESRADNTTKSFEGLTFAAFGSDAGGALEGDDDWARLCELLRERADGLDLLAEAAAKPALGYAIDTMLPPEDADICPLAALRTPSTTEAAPLLFVLLPYLTSFRTAAKLLASDALLASTTNDGARCTRDLLAILGMSIHVEEGNTLISQLVGSGLRSLACQRLVMVLESRPHALTDAQLQQLAATLRDFPDSAFQLELSTETLVIEDMLQRMYSDDGNGDGLFNPHSADPILTTLTPVDRTDGAPATATSDTLAALAAPFGALVMASRKETLEACTSLYEKTELQSTLPLWKQNFEFKDEFERTMNASLVAQSKWVIPRLLIPAVARTATTRRLCEGEVRAAQLAIALEQYRRAHDGHWPATLSALAPEYLAHVPLDPYTGEALNYALVDSNARVWSVGANKTNEHGAIDARSNMGGGQADWLWFASGKGLERWRTNR